MMREQRGNGAGRHDERSRHRDGIPIANGSRSTPIHLDLISVYVPFAPRRKAGDVLLPLTARPRDDLCGSGQGNGAEGGTRTPMGRPTRPSNVRVYQFHHFGVELFLSHECARTLTNKKEVDAFPASLRLCWDFVAIRVNSRPK